MWPATICCIQLYSFFFLSSYLGLCQQEGSKTTNQLHHLSNSFWSLASFPGCLPGNEATWELFQTAGLASTLISSNYLLQVGHPYIVAWKRYSLYICKSNLLGHMVLEAFSSRNCWSVRDLERNLLKYCHSNGQWVRIRNCSLHRNLKPFREDLQWTVRNRYATANSNIPYSPHCGL